MSLVVVTPDKSELMGARDLSQNIIQELMKTETLNVVGIGNSITLVIAAVNISRNIANVNIKSVSIDYIPLTTNYRPEAIFFELSKAASAISSIVKSFEAQSHDTIAAQSIGVRRSDRIETATSIILWKLNKYDTIKVMASGFAIMTAIRSALQVTTSGITRQQVGINAITVDSVEREERRGEAVITKKVPAIQVYLEKGKETCYPVNHKEVIEKVTAR